MPEHHHIMLGQARRQCLQVCTSAKASLLNSAHVVGMAQAEKKQVIQMRKEVRNGLG